MNVSINHPTNKVNFTCVTVGDLSIWFSYETPIAFQYAHGGFVIRENDWGPTTGKHIGYLSNDKSRRIPGEQFEKALAVHLPKDEAMAVFNA